MNDIVFLIPISLECPERKRNLLYQLRHLLSFDAAVYLYECDVIQKVPDVIGDLIDKIQYKFIESSVFHRTQLLNQMVVAVNEFSIIVLHDVDVFINKQQSIDAAVKISSGALDFCYPYTVWNKMHLADHQPGRLWDESFEIINRSHRLSPGGSIFCRRASFIGAGMENENFVGWGYEDVERFWRWTILGYKIGRIDGDLYHAEHPRPRGGSSSPGNPHCKQNKLEVEKIKRMSRPNLEQYIQTWPWLPPTGTV